MGATVLIDALAARYGGTAYAAVQLARHLSARPQITDVFVTAQDGSIVAQGLEGEVDITCITPRLARWRVELIQRLVWEARALPGIVEEEHVDLLVSMSGMLPRAVKCDSACLLFNPVMYERRTPTNLIRRWAVRRSARRALFIAAPSHHMARLVSASVGVQCAVVPLGVDRTIFRPGADPGDQILYVADFYSHKRHDLLLEAWRLLPAPRPTLHFVGRKTVDPRAYARVIENVKRLQHDGHIVVEHEITLKRLVAAYQQARVFVMPSLRESFGMPIAESMACGVPTVLRDIPSLRETGGEGAIYVDGDDAQKWAATIQRVVESDAAFQRAREAAVRASGRYSWDTLAGAIARAVSHKPDRPLPVSSTELL